jgi:hypothetical protein
MIVHAHILIAAPYSSATNGSGPRQGDVAAAPCSPNKSLHLFHKLQGGKLLCRKSAQRTNATTPSKTQFEHKAPAARTLHDRAYALCCTHATARSTWAAANSIAMLAPAASNLLDSISTQLQP